MKTIIFTILMLMSPMAAEAKDVTSTMVSAISERSILKSGDYVWDNSLTSSSDPVSIRVNLTTQMAYVTQGDKLVGVTSISSGRPGYETPEGSFTILGKEDNHHSKKYDADMHWTMWVNNDGVALHSGGTPGRPSSHGCVHLPEQFAQSLYRIVKTGTVVTITSASDIDLDIAL